MTPRALLLDIAPYPVTPAIRGGALAIHQANMAVSSHLRIRLVSQGLRRDEWRTLFRRRREFFHTATYQERRIVSPLAVLLGYASGQRAGGSMLSADRTFRSIRSPFLDALFTSADLIQVEHPWQVPSIAELNDKRRPLIMVAHNVECLVAEQVTSPRREVEAIRQREREAVALSDAVIAFTDDDRRELIGQSGADPSKVHVIPLGVDTGRIRPATPEAKARAKAVLGLEGKRVALFVGSLYEPNVEAVSALVEIASKLDRKDLVFLVVGRVGERFRSTERVRVTGGVDDVAPYFAAADLAVNPMRSGGGMQVKLLEFLAAGLPTVTTPVGIRGVAAVSGRDLIAAELDGFAEAIGVCLNDESCAAEMGRSGRRLVEDQYGWSAIGRARVALYERLVGRSPHAQRGERRGITA